MQPHGQSHMGQLPLSPWTASPRAVADGTPYATEIAFSPVSFFSIRLVEFGQSDALRCTSIIREFDKLVQLVVNACALHRIRKLCVHSIF